MGKFRYPVDIDQFQNIREQGYVYVDKTDLMYGLVNKYNYVFLARPRRFGKSRYFAILLRHISKARRNCSMLVLSKKSVTLEVDIEDSGLLTEIKRAIGLLRGVGRVAVL